MYSVADSFAVICAQILRDNNARSDGCALTESNQQIDQRSAGPYGGKRIASHKISNDDGICGIVKLLQQISKNQRNREKDNFFQNISIRHKPVLADGFCLHIHDDSSSYKYSVPQYRSMFRSCKEKMKFS